MNQRIKDFLLNCLLQEETELLKAEREVFRCQILSEYHRGKVELIKETLAKFRKVEEAIGLGKIPPEYATLLTFGKGK